MKRIISILLILILCLGMIGSFNVFAKEVDELTEHQVNLLILADIVEKQDLTDEFLSGNVSRAQFVLYASRAMNMSEQAYTTEQYYIDMEGHWASDVVNAFAVLGHLSVGTDKKFRPDDAITSPEALKIILSVLGYGNLANHSGGYPSGYYTIANRIKLKYPAISGNLTVKDALALIADSLERDMYDMRTYSEDFYSYYTDEDGVTLLSKYHEKFYAKGTVEAVNTISLEEKSCKEGQIIISGDTYNVSEEYILEDFLGLNVEAYYTENKDSGDRKIELLEITSRNSYEDFSIDRLHSVKPGYVMEVKKDNTDKLIDYKLARDLILIINGTLENTEIQKKLNSLNSGYIRIVDRDEDGVYDYCIVKNYYPFVLNAEAFDETIYDEISGEELKLSDYKYLSIVDGNRNKINLSSIKAGSLVSVAKSSEMNAYIELLYSDDDIFGEIESIDKSENDTYVVINSVEYKLNSLYFEKYPVKVGTTGNFLIDAFGNIVYYIEELDSDVKYGLLVQSAKDTGLSGGIKFKIFTSNEEMKIIEASKKITVDGTLYKSLDKAFETLNNNNIQVIQYKLDENGYIVMIDTISPNKNGNDYNEFRMEKALPYNLSSPLIRFFDGKDGRRIGMNGFITKQTVTFCIDASKTELANGEYDEDDFSVMQYDELLVDRTVDDGNAELYYTKKPAIAAKVLVLYEYDFGKGAQDYTKDVFVIKKVKQALDENGNEKTVIEGYDGRYIKLEEYYLRDGLNIDVDSGDSVVLILNNRGEVNEIKMIYDCSQGGEAMAQVDKSGNSYWNTKNNYYQNGTAISPWTFSFMYASYVDESFVGGFYDYSASPYEVDEAFDSNNCSIIYVYSDARGTYNVRIGDKRDIKEACTVGNENCSKLLVNYVGAKIRCCVVYE